MMQSQGAEGAATCSIFHDSFALNRRASRSDARCDEPIKDAIGHGRIADLFVPRATGNCDVRMSERT